MPESAALPGVGSWLAEVGYLCLLLGLALSVVMLFDGLRQYRRPRGAARAGSSIALALLLSGALLILLLALALNDFSLHYVMSHSNSALALPYRLAAAWGGHEGSLLLWSVSLAVWQATAAWRWRGKGLRRKGLTLALGAIIQAALLLFIVTLSDPFARQFPAPLDGRDLNPMLQHPALLIHPPLLYLSYAGFLFSAAQLLAGLFCQTAPVALARLCLRSVAISWSLLTAGMILGSWWAWSELGWGGWWFWDPVENAALLPWLTGIASLHALSVMRHSGHLSRSATLLVLATGLLTLLGTLIVRSGVLMSVHAFALDETRGLPLLALFTLLSLGALSAFAVGAWRYRRMPDGPVPGVWLVGGLWLFVASALVVLFGTLFPILYRLAGGGQISVGAPWFNQVLLPFALVGIALMLAASRRGRWPAWLAHSGVLLCAVGIASSALLRQEVSVLLTPGESVSLAGYRFTLQETHLLAAGNYGAEQLTIGVWRDTVKVATLRPERRFYSIRGQQMFEPDTATNGWRDWYALVGEKPAPGRYAVRLYVQSGVRLIWGGGVLMLLGAAFSGVGRKRR